MKETIEPKPTNQTMEQFELPAFTRKRNKPKSVVMPEDPIALQETIHDLEEKLHTRHTLNANVRQIEGAYEHGDFSTMVEDRESTPDVIDEEEQDLRLMKEKLHRLSTGNKTFMQKAAMVAAFVGSIFAGGEATRQKNAEAKLKNQTEIAAK